MKYFVCWILLWPLAVSARPIDTTEIVRIGHIRQVITLKGADRDAPLLLYLHGGPGTSVMDQAGTFTDQLQQHFVVVQWDQRETGKTLALNPSDVPLSVALMVNDTHELILYLLKAFGQKKLYLAGHSWGTVLGFGIARQYPELLQAWVAISPMIDQVKSEQMTLAMLKRGAAKTNTPRETQELERVKVPFESWQQLYYARKWLFSYQGQPLADKDTTRVQQYLSGWASTWLAV